jgi:uncharacterized protein
MTRTMTTPMNYPRKNMFRSLTLATAIAGLISGGLGCAADWHSASKTYLTAYEQGDFKSAAADALHCAHNSVPTDALLFDLDAGTTQRAAGDIGQSNAQLDDADALVGKYEEWADVSVSEEVAAALVNARTTAYRGKMSDLVMLNTYRAINFMEMGKNNGARSMLIRAAFVQKDIAQKYQADLDKEATEADADKKKNSDQFDTDKSVDAANKQMAANDQDLLNLKAYGRYVNPFCDYMQGIYFMGAALDQSDKETASTAFKRASSMEPDNAYIKQDIADAENVANGKKLPPLTYVIFETGTAPETDQIAITIPLFLVNRQAPDISLNFPYMRRHGDFVGSLGVDAGGTNYPTSTVVDMDSVILQEFKNTLPTVTTRMIISAATKAAIQAGAEQATKGNAYASLGTNVGMLLYQVATNQADLRTWRTLPKQIQVARFPTPADHKLVLTPGDSSGRIAVDLEDGPINLVYAKSVRRGVPMVVRHFVIKSDEYRAPTAAPVAVAQ